MPELTRYHDARLDATKHLFRFTYSDGSVEMGSPSFVTIARTSSPSSLVTVRVRDLAALREALVAINDILAGTATPPEDSLRDSWLDEDRDDEILAEFAEMPPDIIAEKRQRAQANADRLARALELLSAESTR